ncbi:ABC-type transport system involved in multi-copper enzyme maturation permease subunit [Actinoalloteichus hoggarensis]|uniref:ABC-2 family transporter protein n=1 Tax=Actinoalloteichus hoggarensis TaxID=1470176 RepID=A0A221W9Y5_9PSEU|nr:ABC transporter permease subunit [Actinoalloteichus hoggarensis]ASO22433.1 ABC-2 family transporter protein [Actinoalloteichus hoggarensis]MBB5923143.1 ABC-type transport system involved in multi-copper enzyme maturation permease subunit [Actinoalloteichus hoggarensis]
MNRLIQSEIRKIFTTNLWWGLLIPAGLLCFLLSLLGGTAGSMFGSALSTEVPDAELEGISGLTSLFTSMTFTTGLVATGLFAGIFGALGMAGEFRHKTITTTFLVSDSRGRVLAAKTIVYAGMGALYGVTSVLLGSLGAGIGSSFRDFPDLGVWLLISLVAVVVMALWAVLGLGLGALMTNQAGVVLTLVLVVLLGEGLIATLFAELGVDNAANYLPGGAASALLFGLAISLSLNQIFASVPEAGDVDQLNREVPEAAAFTDMATQWWISGLVFVVWCAVFLLLGMLANSRRDVS